MFMKKSSAIPLIPLAISLLSACVAGQSAWGECLPAPAQLVEPGMLTIGTSLTAPPMGFMHDGAPTGFDPELISAIAEKMCLRPHIVSVTFQGLFPGLLSGKFDVVSSQIGITEKRKQAFDFFPVFIGGFQLVVSKDNALRFETLENMCGKSISIVSGSSQMSAIERVKSRCPTDAPLTLKILSNQSEAMNEVAKKSVDAAYVDWPVAAYLIAHHPDEFSQASPIFGEGGANIQRNRNGIMFRKGDANMETAVEAGFRTVVQSGAYDQILKKWNLEAGDFRKAD